MQFLTVLLMEVLAGVEVDIFVPSFPQLQRIFQLTPFMVELTLGVNLFAHCLSALIVGNMGDRYGRKPVIIYCLIIFIIGSVLCVFAGEFWHLLVGRFLQGIGISGPAVLAYVIVADMYTVEQQQKLLGILSGAISLAMACAPVVGSYVNLYFSWRGNFVILLALGVLSLLLTIIYVPKREPDYSVSLNLKEYLPLLRSKKAVYAMSLLCMLTIGYWVFIPLAPILYMDDMGVGLKEFGFYQGSLAATFSVVSLSSAFWLGRFGQRNCFMTGMGFLVFYLVVSIPLLILDVRSPMLITGALLLVSLGIIFPVNILYPYMLETVKNVKGKLAALMLSVRMLLTAFLVQLVSYFYQGTFLYIGITIFITLSLSLVLCYQLFKIDNVLGDESS